MVGLSADTWAGAILGAVLGSIVIPVVSVLLRMLLGWWHDTRPPLRLLEGLANREETCRVFVRDLVLEPDSKVLSIEPREGIGVVPNIHRLLPEVEGKGLASVFSVLGQVGKTKNIQVVNMSEDVGAWNCHVIVLGAQARKAFDFYRLMKNVAYQMDDKAIYDVASGKAIDREPGFGYGIILKADNPLKTEGKRGLGFLIGGFGTLGTAAAAYYFREHFRELGKTFGNSCFGIVVRVPVTAGEEAVERLRQFDRRMAAASLPMVTVPAAPAKPPEAG